MSPNTQERQDERITSLEHAVFGIGEEGGLLSEFRAFRNQFEKFSKEMSTALTEGLARVESNVNKVIFGVGSIVIASLIADHWLSK